MSQAVASCDALVASIIVTSLTVYASSHELFSIALGSRIYSDSDDYRQLWQQMLTRFDAYNASRLMVEALYIAAKQDKEQAVATYLITQLQAGNLSLTTLQRHFQVVNSSTIPAMQVQQHSLSQYDQLLSYVPTEPPSSRDTTSGPQEPQTVSYPAIVAELRATSYHPPMVLHSISADTMRIREYAALSITSTTSAQGGATTFL